MTEFETLFLQTTLGRTLQDFGWLDLDQVVGQNFRDRHNLVFNSMETIGNMPGPQFVYVHLIMPHPPFVFGPNGEHTDPADYWNEQKKYPPDKFKIGYVNQTIYLNAKLLEMIDPILAESGTPPIILLQGDHGPWSQPNPQHPVLDLPFSSIVQPPHDKFQRYLTTGTLKVNPLTPWPDPSIALRTSGLGLLRVDPERCFFTPP